MTTQHKPTKPQSTWVSISNPLETDGQGHQQSTPILVHQVGGF